MWYNKYIQINEGGNIMNISYIRVSSVDQNEQRQIEAMKNYNIEKWFTEKVSAKDTNRPKLQELLEFARAGDTIHIHDFSRLARSTMDLLNIVDQLNARGVTLISNKENIDTSTPTGKLMLTMIGAINEFERTNLLERQREGIEIAKRAGKFKGRKEITICDNDFKKEYDRYLNRKITKVQMANILKVSRPPLNKLINSFTEKGTI
jgi:DNA invertase Pin-like site-specific DNA recombinase